MVEIKDTPIIKLRESIESSLLEMTRPGLGFLVVTDQSATEPLGIFTDGDLRRILSSAIDIGTVKIDDVMSSEFIVIDEGLR